MSKECKCNDWISVKDESPKDEEIVIVGRVGQKMPLLAKYYKLLNQYCFHDMDLKATHWMNLPKSPKGK